MILAELGSLQKMKSSRKLGLSVKCQNLGHEVTNT